MYILQIQKIQVVTWVEIEIESAEQGIERMQINN